MKMPLFRSTAAATIAALLMGDFALLGIAFNDDGKAVIHTPPLVNSADFARWSSEGAHPRIVHSAKLVGPARRAGRHG